MLQLVLDLYPTVFKKKKLNKDPQKKKLNTKVKE